MSEWIALHEHYHSGTKCSRAENDRRFNAFAGCAPEVAECIYLKYQHPVSLPTRNILLMVLHFLKDNPSEDNAAARFGIGSRNTYRKYVWNAIEYLDYIMDEIRLDSRFSGIVPQTGIFANIALVVDGTDCPIDRPSYSKKERCLYSCGRHKENTYGRYNVKYTVGVQISTGKICVVLGPEPGSVADITGLRSGELIAMISSQDPFEIILADKGYQGLNNCLSPIKGTALHPSETAFNEVLASVRQIVECVLHRIKIFGVLGGRGRFHCEKDKHKAIFNVCSQITNISLERSPVWQHTNWYLSDE